MFTKCSDYERENIELINYCKTKNIKFLSTGFDIDSLSFLMENGLKKIGFSDSETQGILGNNWYNFYKSI